MRTHNPIEAKIFVLCCFIANHLVFVSLPLLFAQSPPNLFDLQLTSSAIEQVLKRET